MLLKHLLFNHSKWASRW